MHVGLDVGNVLQVGTLLHQAEQRGLVDNLLACGVHHDAALLHLAHQFGVDALACLCGSGDVEGNHIALLEEFHLACGSLHSGTLYCLSRAESVVCHHLHAEALGYACHVAANITEGQDAQLLAHQLSAAGSVVEVAHCHYEHAEHQFCHTVGILSGSVHCHHTGLCAGLKVKVVKTGTGADNNLQVLGSLHHLGVNLVGAHNESIGIGNGL